ncbi:MAG: patatin-like phospholipase family protein [Achromobacter mucicolens]|uniref:patatin-like phospholipase family protein n=1 Tax=Achromobacter mucicolens TaxID=1389922 RepID=UPI0015CD0E38
MNALDTTAPSFLYWVSALVLAVLLAAPSCPASADASTDSQAKLPTRPRIGLVLAGGGAKGGAHVGVLKVLEELKIPIDYVAGTSMGSIVGGLYASGMRPQEIEREIESIDWQGIFIDSPNREDLSFRRKQDDLLYVFKMKPGFNEGEIKLPLAYVHGQKFDLQLNRLTARVSGIKDFARLPIPFRAVATDLETGREVVLKSGNLARALRASMAVPLAFDPVEIDGKLLIDGGTSNNVPVNVARAMGADIVIVSDLGSGLLKRDQINSAVDVTEQIVNFLFALNSEEQLRSLGPRDVLITSDLGDIGASSFDRVNETIVIGERAARQAAKSLRQYALNKQDYARYLASHAQPPKQDLTLAFVRIENQSKVSDAVIASHIRAKPGEPINVAQLEQDIQEIYGLEIFESVRYELVEQDGETGLVVRAKERPWGPGYLQGGLITSSNFKGDAPFRLGVAYTRTQINSLNGELRLGGQIGDEPSIFGEIFQPIDPAARYFVSGRLGYLTRNVNLFDSSGNNIAQARTKGYGLELGAGRQFGTWGEARLGYYYETGKIDNGIGAPTASQNYDTGMVFLRLTDDKLDSLYFPSKGHIGKVEYRLSRKAFGADTDFEQMTLGYQHAYSWGRNTLFGGLVVNLTMNENAPIQSLYRLGGFLRLSGFSQDELSGQQTGLARVVYLRHLNDTKLFKAYAGASLEAGNVWENSGTIFNRSIFAGSVFVGADTPIGPLYLGAGHTSTGSNSVYLFLGPLFSF